MNQKTELTPRELQILQHMANGYDPHETAELACVSKRTVDFHLRSIYDKLQVRTLMKAVVRARGMGLIK